MKPSLSIPAWIASGMLLSIAAVHAESDISLEPRDISRFETIWKKSPFVAVTDLSGQVDDLTGRFVLTGFARMGEKDVIFLFDRTSLERFTLTPGETRQGLALQSLKHEGNLKSVRATVASGGRSLDLTYDPAQQPEGTQPAQAGMPFMQGKPGQPGMVQQAAQQIPPPSNPNQIVGAAQTTGEPAPPPPRRVIRRRAIVAPE